MNRRTTVIALGLAAAGALALSAGCRKKPPTTTESARPPAETPAPETRVAPPPAAQPPAVESNVLSEDLRELNQKGYLKDAYFDYDKADLRDDARSALAADAEWLKKYRSIQFLIEGHCDERGTSEYNLALGDRRANAAREYLASLGIDGSRIRTVSYGKERPFCTQSTESCWQENRRAHFLITAK
jgi:peptidoglycan-associated lipoprotein